MNKIKNKFLANKELFMREKLLIGFAKVKKLYSICDKP